MDRPFREVHELYKILYQRAEAQQEAEKARKEREAEEARREQEANRPKGINSSRYTKTQPSDVNSTIPEPSPLEAEALEDMLEELL